VVIWRLLARILATAPNQLGRTPTNSNDLGMTSHYTHTRPETQRQQIEQALRRCPAALAFAMEMVGKTGPKVDDPSHS
jgi:hypothetical protein